MSTSHTSSLPARNFTFSPRRLHETILLLLLFISIFHWLLDLSGFISHVCTRVRPAQAFNRKHFTFHIRIRLFYSLFPFSLQKLHICIHRDLLFMIMGFSVNKRMDQKKAKCSASLYTSCTCSSCSSSYVAAHRLDCNTSVIIPEMSRAQWADIAQGFWRI